MKINTVRKLLFLVAVSFTQITHAQPTEPRPHPTSPIPAEVAFGADGWSLQLIIDKKIAADSRFGFFALSYLRADYDNDQNKRESMNLALIKYDLIKHVSLLSGAIVNSQWGFRPYAGSQFSLFGKNFMGALITGTFLTETHNYEALAMAEYTPAIAGNWSLFTRVQGLYNQNSETGKHDRSHLYGRLGLSYNGFTFGGAVNFDWFGPEKIEERLFGVFVRTMLW